MKEQLRSLSLEITGKCNLTCSHCYAESGPRLSLRGEMAKEDWLKLIDEAAALGCEDLTFIGGEPTLHPDLPALIERAAAHGFRQVEVFTNATQLKPDLLATFRRFGVGLAASFIPPTRRSTKTITGGRGSFRRTVAGLEAAVAAGLAVRIGIVEMAANRGHATAAAAFLEGLGCGATGSRSTGCARSAAARRRPDRPHAGPRSQRRRRAVCGPLRPLLGRPALRHQLGRDLSSRDGPPHPDRQRQAGPRPPARPAHPGVVPRDRAQHERWRELDCTPLPPGAPSDNPCGPVPDGGPCNPPRNPTLPPPCGPTS